MRQHKIGRYCPVELLRHPSPLCVACVGHKSVVVVETDDHYRRPTG